MIYTKLTYYELAAHINPDDPKDGAHQIDTAILNLQRARYAKLNRWRFYSWVIKAVIMIPFMMPCLPISYWLIRMLPPEEGFLKSGRYLENFPVWLSLTLIPMSIVIGWISIEKKWDDPDQGINQSLLIPNSMTAWFKAHDNAHGLRYWHEVCWPHLKRAANKREVCGFVFWHKKPAPLDVYEKLQSRKIARMKKYKWSENEIRQSEDWFATFRQSL